MPQATLVAPPPDPCTPPFTLPCSTSSDGTRLKLVNSFGLFVALAFVAAAFCARKWTGNRARASFSHINHSDHWGASRLDGIPHAGLVGFILGWKFIYLAVNAGELFQTGMPQRHLFSLEGSPPGAVLAAFSRDGATGKPKKQ